MFEPSNIHDVNVQNLDLNLLTALDALLETGGVASAASRLGLSQPAVSNALRRLQESLGRRLFTRHGRRLVPTPETLALAPILRSSLVNLEKALFRPTKFEPRSAEAIVTLAMSDYWHAELLPLLVAELEQHAPRIQLRAAMTGEDVLSEGLPQGDVNAAIYLFPRVHAGVQAELLLADGYVLAVRRGHPLARRKVTIRELARQRQMLVKPHGPWAEQLADAFHSEGVSPQIALDTAQTRAAMDIVSRTDYVAVVARGVGLRMRRDFALRLLPLPVPSDGFKLALYWHDRCAADPLQIWFRALVVRLARQVYRGTTGRRRRSSLV